MKCAQTPAPRRKDGVVTTHELGEYDEIIDARSPAEFAEDHLPGAINLPVLDNEERARIGTLHKQVSAFEAKKAGAALVSRNIAHHLDAYFAEKPKGYRPLVYCWRGGSRSGAFTTILRAVGWSAAQLEGGYKAYRHHVIEALERLPKQFRFVVICGPTGVGKSRFLRALRACGAQVLDLEEMAAHMGSVLGGYPDRPQPSQKYFETLIWDTLRKFDPHKPVFVESESKKIGKLQTPDVLLQTVRASDCINLMADIPVRIALLKEEYAHFLADAQALGRQLDCLTRLQGKARIDTWKAQGQAGQWDELVAELLACHYDPAYARSLGRNYMQASQSPSYTLKDHHPSAFLQLAQMVLATLP